MKARIVRTVSKRIALASLFAVAAVLLLYFWRFSGSSATSRTEKLLPVTVAVALKHTVANLFNAIATVQALNTVVVHPRVDGVIEKVLFQEGRMVRRGEVLVELDKLPFEVQVRAARAQLKKDVAQYNNIKQDVARYQFLVDTDSGPAQTLDTAKALLAQLAAAIEVDQTQIDQALLQLGYTTIRSPIDGRLGARLIDVGNVVHASDAAGLVVISQLRPATVVFALPQSELPVLRKEQALHNLQVVALDPVSHQALATGSLTFIDSQIDLNTGSIRCKATFANGNDVLWPGAFVNVQVVLNNLEDAVVVPTRAIQAGAQAPYVYVVTTKNIVEMRNVTTGVVVNGETVITAGLHADEQVVLDGQFQLENGTRVAVQSAAPPLR